MRATLSFSVAFVFFLLTACGGQVKPEKTIVGEMGNAQGQWRGKALVKDPRKNGTLDLDLIAKEPSALRIEAASSFGIPVASVAMSGGRIEILLPQEKRFITSPADRGSLSRLIPVHISPESLIALLFDRPLDRDKEWKCDRAGAQFTCKTSEGVYAQRELDEGSARKFHLWSQSADVKLSITEAKAKVQATSGLFQLEPPTGYKTEMHGSK